MTGPRAIGFIGGAAGLLAGALSILVMLSPIDPVRWSPPGNLLAADACATAPAVRARVLADGLPGAPDGLAFAPDGHLLVALSNGEVAAIDPATGRATVAATGGGFLTGLAATDTGRVYAVDERAGTLLAGQIGSRLRPVVSAVAGRRLSWTNDVAAMPDGRILFTTTATGRSLGDFYPEVLEHRGSGLLVAYHPATGRSDIVGDRLRMTNGVAATSDGRGVLVAESAVYGVGRIDSGGRRGPHLKGLPGFTGNIRAADRPGAFWLTLLSPRSALVDSLADRPWVRRLLVWLPASVRPGPVALPCLIELRETASGLAARPLRVIAPGTATSFSTAIEREGRLYLSPASIVAGSSRAILIADLPSGFRAARRGG